MRLLGSELRSEGSFLARRDHEWNLGRQEVRFVVRSMLERGYIKKAVIVENRSVRRRKIFARDIIFRFEGLDVDREIRRISREYRERYRVVGWVVGECFFITFRTSNEHFFRSERVFNSSYWQWKQRAFARGSFLVNQEFLRRSVIMGWHGRKRFVDRGKVLASIYEECLIDYEEKRLLYCRSEPNEREVLKFRSSIVALSRKRR